MDANSTRDADAAELAALYQRAEEAGKAFAAYMEAGMELWLKVTQARAERDAFGRDFRAKHMGLKLKSKTTDERPIPHYPQEGRFPDVPSGCGAPESAPQQSEHAEHRLQGSRRAS